MPEGEASEDSGSRKRRADDISREGEEPSDTKDTATAETDSKDVAEKKEEDNTDKMEVDKPTTKDESIARENEPEEEATASEKEAAGSDTDLPEKDSTATPDATAAAAKPNPYDELKYTIVRNDGKPESMIKLVGLKSLFAKQLPKMPRAYIARLVFDRRHTSLAILSDSPELEDSDEEIIGGICYRAFPEMRFAEIAFCAVNAKHQVKGYGTKLMNLLKKIGAETGIEFYITYADNYAIGYFKKQGFTKSIQMPKGRYLGLIKDYDGGTPMECYVHPSIDFTRVPEMLKAQHDFLIERISLNAQSRTVYPPIAPPDPDTMALGRGSQAAARAMAIPGMAQAGWTLNDLLAATGQGKEADRQKAALKSELLSIVRKIEEQKFSWPFVEPVDTTVVQDYLDVIKEPIDLSTIEKRIRQEGYYRSKQMLFADLMLMVNNCKLFVKGTMA
eukprot:scaffold16630_cov177-Amphora_coffeaeformis.AAC.14